MNKERKTNIIKALKSEIAWYKRQPVKIIREVQELEHLCLNTVFTPHEVAMMPKDVIPDLLINKLAKAFADNISAMPIETSFDEEFNVYKARLDLWMKRRW